MPASSLPTKSAPIAAPLVKIPPPRRAKIEIREPKKSQVFYQQFSQYSEVHYFHFKLDEEDLISFPDSPVVIFVPSNSLDELIRPTLVVFTPDSGQSDEIPSYITKPVNSTAKIYLAEYPHQAEYEPFTPSSFYEIITIDLIFESPGDYFLVVDSNQVKGNYRRLTIDLHPDKCPEQEGDLYTMYQECFKCISKAYKRLV